MPHWVLNVLSTAAKEAQEPVEALWVKPMVLVYALEHVALVRLGAVCTFPELRPTATAVGLEDFLSPGMLHQ